MVAQTLRCKIPPRGGQDAEPRAAIAGGTASRVVENGRDDVLRQLRLPYGLAVCVNDERSVAKDARLLERRIELGTLA